MPLSILSVLSLFTFVGRWLREGQEQAASAVHHRPAHAHEKAHQSPWYATLWLTGVDYFSSLGYAPGLAIMAAGFVAPVATFILVLVTFCAAVPVYAMVAKHSQDGEGSIKMIERLTLTWGRLGWLGKTLVLVLLGFAMTDFVITITLSAADATHHVIQNPLFNSYLPHSPVLLTALLIGGLCLVFLKGFKEAIWLSVAIAFPYMVLNSVIIVVGLQKVAAEPVLFDNWWQQIVHFDAEALKRVLLQMSPEGAGPVALIHGGGPMMLIAVSLLVFPKLALGMSGFETGVSVMPHIAGADMAMRVRNTRKLLIWAAIIMCTELMGANLVTTLLIDPKEFRAAIPGVEGGKAAGRALAFLGHSLLGDAFGTVYDVNTLLILWFAGASAMAGLLNIIPRYLPRFGMSPVWLEYRRPLVLVITAVCLFVNWWFDADVEKQGGAYATGVLVLMASGAFAVLLAERDKPAYRFIFSAILLVFLYVLVLNAAERPDGLKIAAFFILSVIVASVWSRWRRSSEMRVGGVEFVDAESEKLWHELKSRSHLVLIPLRNMGADARRNCEARRVQHQHAGEAKYAFLHINLTDDPSQFATPISVKVVDDGVDAVIDVSGAVAVANAIAFVALELSADQLVIGLLDNGTPVQNAMLYLLFGTGEVGYAVRQIFVRLREEQVAIKFERRQRFDILRDEMEKDVLRQSVLQTDEERHAKIEELFVRERDDFEKQLATAPKLPRLILFD